VINKVNIKAITIESIILYFETTGGETHPYEKEYNGENNS